MKKNFTSYSQTYRIYNSHKNLSSRFGGVCYKHGDARILYMQEKKEK